MLYHYHSIHILIISVIIFVIINIIENVIHYNIGKYSDKEVKIDNPTTNDWSKIIFVMIVFALLQGSLTIFLTQQDIKEN